MQRDRLFVAVRTDRSWRDWFAWQSVANVVFALPTTPSPCLTTDERDFLAHAFYFLVFRSATLLCAWHMGSHDTTAPPWPARSTGPRVCSISAANHCPGHVLSFARHVRCSSVTFGSDTKNRQEDNFLVPSSSLDCTPDSPFGLKVQVLSILSVGLDVRDTAWIKHLFGVRSLIHSIRQCVTKPPLSHKTNAQDGKSSRIECPNFRPIAFCACTRSHLSRSSR